MTPAEQMAPPVVAEAQYRMAIAVQKDGDNRALEVRELIITVPLLVENPMLARLIKAHTQALAAHDAGKLPEAEPTTKGKPN